MSPSTPTARISVVIRDVSWVRIVAHAGFISLFAWIEPRARGETG